MVKPEGYDELNVNFDGLEPGGHKCVIKKVEEIKSKTGKEMLLIYFDTDKGDKQEGFYLNRYLADKARSKDEPVWRGRHWLMTDKASEYGPTNLKRFNTAVEDSNDGFQVQWGDNFAKQFANKKVGIIFRVEEYIRDDYSIGASVKPFRFCNYDKAYDQPVPERKSAPAADIPGSTAPEPAPPGEWVQQGQSEPVQQSWSQAADEGFMQVPDPLNDEGLPFN